MSVAAMTMDDQRPLMNSYDKMSTAKYEQNINLISSGASSGISAGGVGGGGVPPSGPASPTPSGSEESHHHPHHPHHSHHHQHHTPNQEQQRQQLQQQEQQHAAVAEAVAAAEQRQRLLEDEIETLKLEQVRMGQICADAQRREKILMRRLANKEQEFQDYVSQIAEYKAQQAPTALALRTALLDPAVNLLFERLKKELKATKTKLEETQNELSAWKFTPDSNTGKRLMAKCRLLYQENEELGKMTSNGRLAKLETELAMQKSFSEEVKKSQSELDDFLQELDEDVEGMQSTILFLQQELKTTRDRIQTLEKDNAQLKQAHTKDDTVAMAPPTTNGTNKMSPPQTPTPSTIGKLEPIDENVALESKAAHPDYLNGDTRSVNNNEQILPSSVPGEHILPDDVNNSNSNGNGNGNAARLARKRNYEEETTTNMVTPTPVSYSVEEMTTVREVSTPRILPPKKSKLRGMPTRRSSQLEEELHAAATVAATVATPLILDNSATGMVSEEATAVAQPTLASVESGAVCPESIEAGVVAGPARISTRRRSVRMQQNGAGPLDYST
ncbi:pre-mRNA-splicing regulator female-lethal(2)D isoform X1 [Drosophila miranda]|uniref:pre-mRNA-splicing regulator female-lethal(2)D isoform X1 n=2 Tax=Drosophila miranda TaxID=7229 RepID=UPI0007E87025|nr:pre-mRNA-splicing regulator female-lethal(2)D isoform X1 [Drosophila miranda]